MADFSRNYNCFVNSLNLKELGWQKVQGDCDISVSSDGKNIWIKPKLEEDARITTITYRSGDNVWRIFTEEACSEPMLLKQDDSYYEAYRIYAQESLDTFLYTYSTFYNAGDYAGICALSKGIEYSDEQQIEWGEQDISLTQMEVEEGESEDEKKVKCVFQFTDGEKLLYLHLVRENNNWYVNGLPQ